jgi:hypothetical protein
MTRIVGDDGVGGCGFSIDIIGKTVRYFGDGNV